MRISFSYANDNTYAFLHKLWNLSYYTGLHLVGENSDIVSFGADDLRFHVSFLLVRNPAVLFAIERLRLFLVKLLLVRCEVLIVRVVG